MTNKFNITSNCSSSEEALREKFFKHYKNSPIPDNELLANLSLYMKRQDLSDLFFKNDLYKKILGIHGCIMEFGVRWEET